MKRILITGGQGDLGKAIEKRFEKEYELFLPSSKELDVTDKNAVVDYLRNQRFDILINNAGTLHPAGLLESDMDLWEKDIKVNLIGPYFVTKKVLENNAEALVINIASTAAFNAYPNWSSYCASKAGLVTFTKAIANDGFYAIALCPGAIKTKFRNNLNLNNDNAMTPEEFVEQIDKAIKENYSKGDVVFFRKNEFRINP